MKKHQPLFERILEQPTAPFREEMVASVILESLDEARVPWFLDGVGNIVVGVDSEKALKTLLAKKGKEPLRVFIAHMDHPGFHGVQWRGPRGGTKLNVKWHGGAPTEHMDGAKVWLRDFVGNEAEGVLREPKYKKTTFGKMLESATVEFEKEDLIHLSGANEVYGGLKFRAPLWRKGDLVYTRAADDLCGAFAITATAIELAAPLRRQAVPFLGILTRAEEVGFIGAIGHLKQGLLSRAKREILAVSLEASRTLPGAEIGKGPIVRLGDKFTVFDARGLHVLGLVAEKLLPGRHQKRIMDGGRCEASACTVFGVPAVGIAVPLGNYHNQSLQGGPDSRGPNGPAPEFVNMKDVEGVVTLCKGLVAKGLPWADPWKDARKRFSDLYARTAALLK